ncbi:MAG: L,D-transpeptidase family protein [Acidobacteriota bacterium]
MLDHGPATARRRPLLLLLAAALLLGVSCAPPPPPDFDGARAAARRAIRMLRPTVPLKAKYIERLIADAEIATAAERHAPWWAPQTGRATAAWLRVARAASEETAAWRAKRDGARGVYLQLLDEAREHIARARAEIREAGMGGREAAAMARASTLVQTATRLASAGDFERASDKLKSAREMTQLVHKAYTTLHARFGESRLRRQWKQWVDETIADSRDSGGAAIIVDKLRRQLLLYQAGRKVATFQAELGANGLRQKAHAGDQATPEGRYHVTKLKEGSATRYYKALLINYPNDEDRMRYELGRRRGQIPTRASIGSLIEIHGDGGQGRDWTNGCVALTNEDMDRLFSRVRRGTPVTIVGTNP